MGKPIGYKEYNLSFGSWLSCRSGGDENFGNVISVTLVVKYNGANAHYINVDGNHVIVIFCALARHLYF